MLKKRFLYFILILLSANISFNAHAQKSKTAGKTTLTVKNTVQEEAKMIYENMLPSTEQIMIIDSVIVDKNDFINSIPLTKE